MSLPQSTVGDRIWAALMFFTRLPFWRIRKDVPQEAFRHVVEYWTLSGWLTGGVLAGVFWLSAHFFPTAVALLLALSARMLLTGALHEDGLADFMDGFGGGHNRERILAIMKDSHIGTFGVLGLVLYLALLYGSWLYQAPSGHLAFQLLFGDLYAKACSSFLICRLPYARRAEEAKIGTTYLRPHGRQVARHVLRVLVQLFPALLVCILSPALTPPLASWLAAPVCVSLLILYLRLRIQGYTGDCCGAVFLLSELTFHLAALAALNACF